MYFDEANVIHGDSFNSPVEIDDCRLPPLNEPVGSTIVTLVSSQNLYLTPMSASDCSNQVGIDNPDYQTLWTVVPGGVDGFAQDTMVFFFWNTRLAGYTYLRTRN